MILFHLSFGSCYFLQVNWASFSSSLRASWYGINKWKYDWIIHVFQLICASMLNLELAGQRQKNENSKGTCQDKSWKRFMKKLSLILKASEEYDFKQLDEPNQTAGWRFLELNSQRSWVKEQILFTHCPLEENQCLNLHSLERYGSQESKQAHIRENKSIEMH